KKTKTPDPAKMKPETVEKVVAKELWRDERTHKIIGAFFLLISFLLFVAFTSYLFTWQEDQSKVFKGAKILLPSQDQNVANMLGTAGAYFSDLFIRQGFGIASYLFCTLFFIIGVNLLFGRRLFSLSRNIKYLIAGLIVISVTASFLMKGQGFAWGGAAGDTLNEWMQQIIGRVGTAAVLLIAVLSYIIWRFNPVFNLSKKKEIDPDSEGATLTIDDSFTKHEEEDENELTSFQTNSLQEVSNQMIAPKEEPIPNFDLQLIEKEENTVHIPQSTVDSKTEEKILRDIPKSDLELEIKSVPQKIIEEITPAAKSETVKPYDPILDLRDYKYPKLDLLETHGSEQIVRDPAELETNKNQIINTLKNYDIEIEKIMATVGPTVTLYEIVPKPGVRISRIKNLEDDIALSLAALGIRIIAPIPGKGTIGIEVPNVRKTVVSMKTLLSSEKFQHNNFSLPIAIGKKIDNDNFIVDLTNMPHLLMAGATGQGKSVGLNAILVSLLYKKHPSQLKFVLVDPKKVELSIYSKIQNHFLAKLPGEEDAIITDTKKVIHTLNALCIEMDNRYDLLKEAGTRNIREYNEKFVARKLNPEKGHQYLPFIVLVIDEFADLIMTAGKEVEMPLARLAQLARAVGIHLIIATQRPSVNIITGTIKANFPARIAFKVSSKIDSRTILDVGGAEQLIGKGDMLISYNGELTRLQCAFVDTPEVDEITEFIGDQRGYPQPFLLPEYVDEKELEAKGFDLNDKDPLFDDAARLIVASQVGSTSLLQRRMKLGYNRAGRLMDQLEAAGVVGQNQGSKARDVLIKTETELQQYLNGG
ncbi:MAG TPA: DNA translocase FtsK 4TM domain-containing protein, partial [Chitinophagaceae bacterium]|nr:DNA translocase FtsK 4TM domain-containing protein [Chitinophagaceae bacterium]